MVRLTHREFDRLNHGIGVLYDPVGPDHFPQLVFQALEGLFPYELAGVTVQNRKRKAVDAYMSRQGNHHMLEVFQHLDDYYSMPGVRTGEYFSSSAATSIHDYMSMDRFKGTAIYNLFYRPLDVLYDATLNIPEVNGLSYQINVARKANRYSPAERTQLHFLQPHIARRFQWIRQEHPSHPFFGQGLLVSEQTWILCNSEGVILSRSPGADAVLASIHLRCGQRIPAPWQTWLSIQLAPHRTDLSLRPLDLTRGKTRVVAHCMPNLRSGEHRIILVSGSSSDASLTNREKDVLKWIQQAKSNAEIAAILGISRGTVKIHVERILDKLGVDSRTAAALAAEQ